MIISRLKKHGCYKNNKQVTLHSIKPYNNIYCNKKNKSSSVFNIYNSIVSSYKNIH